MEDEYVKLSTNTDMSKIGQLLNEHWNIREPELILSVVGGYDSFTGKLPLFHQLSQHVTTAIKKVCSFHPTCIITSGYCQGFVSRLSKAIKKEQVSQGTTLVGIPSWNGIYKKEVLTSRKGKGRFPAKYFIINREPSLEAKHLPLDPCHTHYLLVDDGSSGTEGAEVSFRINFECNLAQKFVKGNRRTCIFSTVPIICVVIGGNYSTFRHIEQVLQRNQRIVIVPGGGGAADVLINILSNRSESILLDTDKKKLQDTLCEVFKLNSLTHQSQINDCLQAIVRIINQRNKIKIPPEPISSDSLEDTIFTSLRLLSQDDDEKRSLEVVWNKVDLSELISNDLMGKTKSSNDSENDKRLNRPSMTSFRPTSKSFNSLSDSAVFTAVKLSLKAKRKRKSLPSTEYSDVKATANKADIKKSSLTVMGQSNNLLNNTAKVASKAQHKDKRPPSAPDLVRLEKGTSWRTSRYNALTVLDATIRDGMKSTLKALINKKNVTAEQALEIALTRNRITPNCLDIIEYLINEELVDMSNFKKIETLERMYETTWDEDSSIMRWASDSKVITEEKKRKSYLYQAGKAFSTLLGDQCNNVYADIDVNIKSVAIDMDSDSASDAFIHLFLWSILTGRYEISFLLWKRVQYPIAAAIAANRVLWKMSDKFTGGNSERFVSIPDQLRNNAIKLMNLAIKVMDEQYKINKKNTMFMLLREIPELGKLSCFSMAFSSNSLKRFNTHEAYVHCLHYLWTGDFEMETPMWKISLGFILPLPCLLFSSFIRNKKLRIGYNSNTDISTSDCSSTDDDEFTSPYATFIDLTCRVYRFYTTPRIKFIIAFLFYLAFLAYYAIFLLDFYGHTLMEVFLVLWVLSLVLEEAYQVIQTPRKTIYGKIKLWISDHWNRLDAVALLTFFIIAIVRHSEPILQFGRIFYALNFIVFALRSLQILSMWSNHGPKLVMIRKLLNQLISFLVILFSFVLSFGIATEVVLRSGPRYHKRDLSFHNAFYAPYYRLYGELFLEDSRLNCDNFTKNLTVSDSINCETRNAIANILVLVYMLITTILLLNLLIAIFNKTYDRIEGESITIWRSQYRGLVREYVYSSPLVPPLNLLLIIPYIAQKITCLCPAGHCKQFQKRPFRLEISKEHFRRIDWGLWDKIQEEERRALCRATNQTLKLENNKVVEGNYIYPDRILTNNMTQFEQDSFAGLGVDSYSSTRELLLDLLERQVRLERAIANLKPQT